MGSQFRKQGFTIVELLIVIVIIAILAAITIVAYNGITNRANTSSSKAAANSTIKKIEAYNADDTGGNGSYPAYSALLTGASANGKTYQLTGVTFSDVSTEATALTTAATSPSQLLYYICTTGAGVKYWDYGTKAWVALSTGGAPSDLSGCTYKRSSASS